MDPRFRALLEPKTLSNARSPANINKETRGMSTNPSSPGQQVATESKSNQASSTPVYDPRALLDPRGGSRKSTKPDKSDFGARMAEASVGTSTNASQQLSNAKGPQSKNERASADSRSMIENLYGVEVRNQRPAKRVKHDIDQDNGKASSKANGHPYRSSGIIGEYMRPDNDAAGQTAQVGKIIDLTNDDDVEDSDDDMKVIRARNIANDREVCYGLLSTEVQAHAIPKPTQKIDLYGSAPEHWPVIKCTVLRIPSKDTVIELKDPDGFTFGRIVPELANVLTPIIDTLKKTRLQPRLLSRRKKPGEVPHARCSEKMKLMINFYGRRADVERIGKVLGQHNVWLRNPIASDNGIEIVNPHQNRLKDLMPGNQSNQKSHMLAGSRTVEEATEAVTKLFDHYANTIKPLEETEPSPLLLTTLLPHQKQALTFLLQKETSRTFGDTESENSSLWRKRYKNNGVVMYEEIVTGIIQKDEPAQVYGGLLADVMGLGKTLEALALIVTTIDDAKQFEQKPLVRTGDSESEIEVQSRATLIIAPVSTVKNWEDQISEHVRPATLRWQVYHGQHRERDPANLGKNDIIISTYSTIASELSMKSQSGTSPIKAVRWFRIILDEAHTIREARAGQSQAMYSLHADRRWCLTGTPIQNRLDDLGSLTRFLRLAPYDTTAGFNQYVRSPALSGDSNYLKSLRVLIDSFTLRRLKDRIELPHRRDLVEKLEFSAEERRLHNFYMNRAHIQLQEMADETKKRTVSQHHVLRAIMTLRLICAHGRELLKPDDLEDLKGNSPDVIDIDAVKNLPSITPRTVFDTLALFVEAELDLCKSCDKKITGDSPREDSDELDELRGFMLPCLDLVCHECFEGPRRYIDDMEGDGTWDCPFCSMQTMALYIPIPRVTANLLDMAPENTPHQNQEAYKHGEYGGPSTKVRALLDDLREIREESISLEARGQRPLKSVVFSEFTSNLDLVERALDDHGFAEKYGRIDGSMSLSKRKKVLDDLNNDDNITILLASIKAAGQGLNLIAASRAFIMEPMWNPAAEAQAVDRIYRIGQTRDVVIKRYQITNSIEGKIVQLQQKKQKLAEISMNKNHKLLNKKEEREMHMKEILALFK